MQLFDSHCHIHSDEFDFDIAQEIELATKQGVDRIMLVGEGLSDSKKAAKMASKFDSVWASAGQHPHHASDKTDLQKLCKLIESGEFIAIGEFGLDYWYQNSPKPDQVRSLEVQLRLAARLQLPMIFHIRGSKDAPDDAFNDFFNIYDQIKTEVELPNGVVHSFSAGQAELGGVLSRGLYVGLGGIATFGRADQQEVFKSIPLEAIVLETDAPFLTPVQKRGKVNRPSYLRLTAEYLAEQRGMEVEDFASSTFANTLKLFNLED